MELPVAELPGCGMGSKPCVEVLTRPLRRGSGTPFPVAEEPDIMGTDDIDSAMLAY